MDLELIPTYEKNGMSISFIKTECLDDTSISIEFEVVVNGEKRTDHTSGAETAYIHKEMVKAVGSDYPSKSHEMVALAKACEIYYGMIV